MAVSIVRVEHPELFVGPPEAPEQVVRVTVAGGPGPVTVGVSPGTALTVQLTGGVVRLAWQGLSGTRVNVFRNGTRRATVSNSGSYSDSLGRDATGTLTYKVCVAGTTTCTVSSSVAAGSRSSTARGRRAFHAAHFARAALGRHASRRAYAIRR